MNFLEKMALVIAIPALVFSSSAAIVMAQTTSIVSGVPFGGIVLSFVPPTPLCPYPHSVIWDFASNQPFAITAVPASQIYLNFNFITTGNFVLGSYTAAPLPCALPYKIYPIRMLGTS